MVRDQVTMWDNSLTAAFFLNLIFIAGMAVISWFLRQLDQRIKEIELTQVAKRERLAIMEAHYTDIVVRLNRIELKMDEMVPAKWIEAKLLRERDDAR